LIFNYDGIVLAVSGQVEDRDSRWAAVLQVLYLLPDIFGYGQLLDRWVEAMALDQREGRTDFGM